MSWGVRGTAALWQPSWMYARQSLWALHTAEAVLFQFVTKQPALHLASVPARLLQALAQAHRPCRHKFFNTNNLWVNLDDLQATLKSSGGVLKLPLIKNKKTVNPRCVALSRAASLAPWQSTPGHCSYTVPHQQCLTCSRVPCPSAALLNESLLLWMSICRSPALL